jgi:hypothetical protein
MLLGVCRCMCGLDICIYEYVCIVCMMWMRACMHYYIYARMHAPMHMYVCIHVYMYYVYMTVCTYMLIRRCTSISVNIVRYTCVRMYKFMYVRMYIRLYECTYVMHARIHVCMYVGVCTSRCVRGCVLCCSVFVLFP